MSALMAESSPSSIACAVALTSAVMSPLLAGVDVLLEGAAPDADVALRAVESRESMSLSGTPDTVAALQVLRELVEIRDELVRGRGRIGDLGRMEVFRWWTTGRNHL